MTPALSMTHASVLVLVPFPQLSLRVRSYHPITLNPCALGQQVIALLSQLIVSLSPRVLIDRIIASLYAIVLGIPLYYDSWLMKPYLPYLAYLQWLQ